MFEGNKGFIDPRDRFFLSQHFCDLEYRRPEFATNQHDAQRKLQISRFDARGFRCLFEQCFKSGRLLLTDTGE